MVTNPFSKLESSGSITACHFEEGYVPEHERINQSKEANEITCKIPIILSSFQHAGPQTHLKCATGEQARHARCDIYLLNESRQPEITVRNFNVMMDEMD